MCNECKIIFMRTLDRDDVFLSFMCIFIISTRTSTLYLHITDILCELSNIHTYMISIQNLSEFYFDSASSCSIRNSNNSKQ